MEYQKKKDTTPDKTVEKIKDILKTIGIDKLNEIITTRLVNEHCTESLRLYLPEYYFCGTNGKGTTLEYARASAYGEFMERIQYPYILEYLPPDNKKISINQFLKSNLIEYFLPKEKSKDSKKLNQITSIASMFSKFKFTKSINMIPYNHINTGEVVYLPPELKWYASISTGTSAGNTVHEALVEGFSEIFERHVQTKAVIESISFPDIPEYVYLKYKTIRAIVEYLKKLGMNVQVKDASLNGKFPVVCIAIKKKNDEGYFACFGAHPHLPIAIERCFTEAMQGVDFSDEKNVDFLFKLKTDKDNNIGYARYDNALWHKYIELNNDFFIKNPDYEFNIANWEKAEKMSNKELVVDIINSLTETNIDVFIRNVNFLGFPAFQIYIPELISSYKIINDEIGEDIKYNNYKCDTVFKELLDVKLSEKELNDFFIYLFHLKTKYSHNDYKNLEMYYSIFLILSKKYEKALTILKEMKSKKMFKSNLRLINFFIDYLNFVLLKENPNKIKVELRKKYGAFAVSRLYKLFLCSEGVDNLIKAMKQRKVVVNKKNAVGARRKQEIIANLLDKYSKNIPNQKEVKDLIFENE